MCMSEVLKKRYYTKPNIDENLDVDGSTGCIINRNLGDFFKCFFDPKIFFKNPKNDPYKGNFMRGSGKRFHDFSMRTIAFSHRNPPPHRVVLKKSLKKFFGENLLEKSQKSGFLGPCTHLINYPFIKWPQ
jgi:hypothetical protein